MKNVEIIHAIIIKTERYKEADMRLTLFTPRSLITVIATGALKSTAKLKGVLQLFNVCEVGIIGSRITSAHVLQSGLAIPKDINRYYLSSSICETLLKLMRDSHEEDFEQIFELTKTALEFLNKADTSCREIFIAFYWRLLKILGYEIQELSINAIKKAFLEYLDYNIVYDSN